MADRPRDVAWRTRFQARHMPRQPRTRLDRAMADYARPLGEIRHPAKNTAPGAEIDLLAGLGDTSALDTLLDDRLPDIPDPAQADLFGEHR